MMHDELEHLCVLSEHGLPLHRLAMQYDMTGMCVQVCFIKTTNLDGESNLKIRRPVDLKENAPENINEVCLHLHQCLGHSSASLCCYKNSNSKMQVMYLLLLVHSSKHRFEMMLQPGRGPCSADLHTSLLTQIACTTYVVSENIVAATAMLQRPESWSHSGLHHCGGGLLQQQLLACMRSSTRFGVWHLLHCNSSWKHEAWSLLAH